MANLDKPMANLMNRRHVPYWMIRDMVKQSAAQKQQKRATHLSESDGDSDGWNNMAGVPWMDSIDFPNMDAFQNNGW